jgi:hypothetical protein
VSFWSKLAKIGGYAAAPFTGGASIAVGNGLGTMLEAGGAMAASGSNAAANNRGVQMDADLAAAQVNDQRKRDFINQLVMQQQEGREGLDHAMKAVQRADYIGSTKDYKPAIAGMPSFGFGPKGAGEEEMFAAHQMREEAKKRLVGGNPITVERPEEFKFTHREPGFWEKLGNIVAPGLTILGAGMNAGGDGGDEMDLGFDQPGAGLPQYFKF